MTECLVSYMVYTLESSTRIVTTVFLEILEAYQCQKLYPGSKILYIPPLFKVIREETIEVPEEYQTFDLESDAKSALEGKKGFIVEHLIRN